MKAKVLRICGYERKPPQWAYGPDHRAQIVILPVVNVREDRPPIRRANHKMLPPAIFKPSK